MLGHQLTQMINQEKNIYKFKIYNTTRSKKNKNVYFDVLKDETFKNIYKIKPDYIINCIALLKPRIDFDNTLSLINCIKVNSLLPMLLSNHFKKTKIIHITTNGVYDGKKGNYQEDDNKTCKDFYGNSKSIGEINSNNVMNIRCSLVGFENKTNYSLLNWYIKNRNSKIKGFSNHLWNGISSIALSKIIIGIINKKLFKSGTFHLLPSNKISKYNLICLFNKYFNHKKSKIKSVKNNNFYNGTLKTKYRNFNLKMWNAAGYKKIPDINFLIKELSSYRKI